MLDSIAMMLISIGENIKKIDSETSREWLIRSPGVDWKGVMGLRDVLSHHYFSIDAEEVYDICSRNIDPLQRVIENMLQDLSSSGE